MADGRRFVPVQVEVLRYVQTAPLGNKMNKIVIGSVAALITAVVAYTVFQEDILHARTALEYKALFEPDSIDQNFRSLPSKYDSVTVKRAGPIYALPEKFNDDAIPETFVYEGEERRFDEFMDRTQATGLAVLHNGDLVYEKYYRGNSRDSRAILMSVSKSMASFLIGCAYEDGDIESIDDQVIKYVPALRGTAYDGATIKDVLEMSSGVRWNEDYASMDSDIVQSIIASRIGSLDDFTASVPREHSPGTYNRYASIDTHALGMVLRGATGKSYEAYFEEKLWSKLGAEDDAQLLVDAEGEPIVYGGVNVRLRDMIRFGELYLDGGVNHLGERLISEDWVQTSTRPDSPRLMPGVDNPESDAGYGYKYQWWTPLEADGNDYMALGIYGQSIYVNPKRNVVIARTSAYQNYTVDGGHMLYETLLGFQQIARHLSPEPDMDMEPEGE